MTMAEVKNGYEALGGKFIEYVEPKQLFTGVWLTGPVPRPFPEKNYPAMIHYRDPDGHLVVDNIPEDQSLVMDTDKRLVVLTGCGHAGLISILTYARQTVRPGATGLRRLRRVSPIRSQSRHALLDRGQAQGVRSRSNYGRALHRHRTGLLFP